MSDDSRSTRERMTAGEPYRMDAELSELHCAADELTARYNASTARDALLRREILRDLLGSLGDDVEVRAPIRIDYGFNLHIGDRAFVNFGLVALDVAPITIGADAQIGPNVQLLTATHPLDPDPRRDKWESGAPITLGDNVWLGGGVIVCPGVTIGNNSVIGAGAVVTRNIPANVVAVGNPARVMRQVTP